MYKKGMSLGAIPAAVIILLIIGVISGVGIKMNESLRGSDTTAYKYLAAQNATLGIMEISGNSQLLGLIIIMGAVITILLASFGGFMRGGGGL